MKSSVPAPECRLASRHVGEHRDKLKAESIKIIDLPRSSVSVQALDELLLHHTVEGDVGQVGDEGVTGSSADTLAASEVEES